MPLSWHVHTITMEVAGVGIEDNHNGIKSSLGLSKSNHTRLSLLSLWSKGGKGRCVGLKNVPLLQESCLLYSEALGVQPKFHCHFSRLWGGELLCWLAFRLRDPWSLSKVSSFPYSMQESIISHSHSSQQLTQSCWQEMVRTAGSDLIKLNWKYRRDWLSIDLWGLSLGSGWNAGNTEHPPHRLAGAYPASCCWKVFMGARRGGWRLMLFLVFLQKLKRAISFDLPVCLSISMH